MTPDTSHRILLVDDEPDIRKNLQFLLERHGHRVLTAANCREAIEHVDREDDHPFRVAIVDIRLPDGSGIDVVKVVKQRSPKTICLVITAYPTDENEHDARAAGAQQLFVKPFSVEQLMQFIEKGFPAS